jgi:hypothetical protein
MPLGQPELTIDELSSAHAYLFDIYSQLTFSRQRKARLILPVFPLPNHR